MRDMALWVYWIKLSWHRPIGLPAEVLQACTARTLFPRVALLDCLRLDPHNAINILVDLLGIIWSKMLCTAVGYSRFFSSPLNALINFTPTSSAVQRCPSQNSSSRSLA